MPRKSKKSGFGKTHIRQAAEIYKQHKVSGKSVHDVMKERSWSFICLKTMETYAEFLDRNAVYHPDMAISDIEEEIVKSKENIEAPELPQPVSLSFAEKMTNCIIERHYCADRPDVRKLAKKHQIGVKSLMKYYKQLRPILHNLSCLDRDAIARAIRRFEKAFSLRRGGNQRYFTPYEEYMLVGVLHSF